MHGGRSSFYAMSLCLCLAVLLQGCSTVSKYGEAMGDAAGAAGGLGLPMAAVGFGVMATANALGGNTDKSAETNIKFGEGPEWTDAVARAQAILRGKKVSVGSFGFKNEGSGVYGLTPECAGDPAFAKDAVLAAERDGLIEVLQKAGLYDPSSQYQIAGQIGVVTLKNGHLVIVVYLRPSPKPENAASRFITSLRKNGQRDVVTLFYSQTVGAASTCEDVKAAFKLCTSGLMLKGFGNETFDALLNDIAN